MSGVNTLAGSKVLRAGSVLTILNLAAGAIGYIFQVLMGRTLVCEDFVLFNALMAVVMVTCSPLVAVGLVLTKQVAVIRASGDEGRVQALYRTFGGRLVLACGVGLAMLLASAPVVRQYLRIRDDESLWLFGVILVLTAFVYLNNAFLQGMQQFGWLGGLGVGAMAIKMVLCVVFVAVFGWGVHGALGGVAAAMFCVWVVGVWSISEGSSARAANDQEIPPFAMRLIPSLVAGNIAFVAMTQLDIVLVNHYFEPDLSSQFTAASILGKAVLYLPASLATAIYPMAVEDRATGKGSRDMVTQAVGATLLLCVSAALVYRVAGTWVLAALFGADYARAGHLLAMYGIAMVPIGVAIVVKHFLLAKGQTLFAWLFVVAACVEGAVIHAWHPSLQAVLAVIAVCNSLLAVSGCAILASTLEASHTRPAP